MISIKNNSLKLKIMLLSVVFIMIPVIVVGVLSYRKTYDIMLNATIDSASQLSNHLAESTELSFFEIERLLSIGHNTSSIRFLLSNSNDERTHYLFDLISTINLYRDTYRFSGSVKDIKIISKGNWHFSERKGLEYIKSSEMTSYIDMFSKPQGAMIIHILDGSEMENDRQDFQVLVGAPIYQVATNDVLGVIVLELDAEPFTHFVSNSSIGSKGYFLIADSNHIILNNNGVQNQNDLTTNEMAQIYGAKSGSFIRNIDGRDELIFFSTINSYNWKVIGRVFIDDVMIEAQDIKTYSVMTIVICLFTSALLNIYVTRWLFIPLDKLSKKMRIVAQGDLDVKLTHRTSDEIAQLNFTFNNMILQIKDLMAKNIEEQEKLKKSQLRVLQSQINPHFLYNTLDTIIWLIHAREDERAIEMVDALSQFFRTSLSKGKDFIEVSEELSHVKNYLTIQSSRNWDKLDYEINVNENIMNCAMMKFLLQPLVENAIYHGLKPKNGGGKIWINGWLENDFLVFTVRDNGVGMEPQKLNELREMLCGNHPFSENKHGFGLYNIKERIKLYYMDDCGITINSTPGQGTIITLRIKGTKP
ncbi:MAG: sensor histidine kinase [Anaerolineae bacterium]|nr:sensor histidine kinase [Anaerolineae bacterium]